MKEFIQVSVDEAEFRKILKQKIAEMLQEHDAELVYWDAKELKRRTCMSWNSIQTTFFFDPDFPRRKIGAKWYFPARATRAFLEEWLDKQPNC